MEIIKHGNVKDMPETQNNKKTKCPYCGCEFKYNSGDVRSNHRRGDWDTSREAIAAENGYPYDITCPDCGYWFFIDCLGNSKRQSAFDYECDRAEEKYQNSKNDLKFY